MSSERIITRHRMARAHRLVAVIETLPGTPADHLAFARQLTPADWADKVAVVADHQQDQIGDNLRFVRFEDRTPSDTTIAMALGLLEAAAKPATDDLFAAFA